MKKSKNMYEDLFLHQHIYNGCLHSLIGFLTKQRQIMDAKIMQNTSILFPKEKVINMVRKKAINTRSLYRNKNIFFDNNSFEKYL